MNERLLVTVLLVAAGVALTLWGGLDVDNAWGGIGTFLAGMGIGRLD